MGVSPARTAFTLPVDAVTLAREPAFRIGSCVVRPSLNQVAADGRTVRLEPRVMQVLVVLAHRNGTVVSRDDLLQACWGGVVVGDDALNRCIVRLRAVLRELDVTGVGLETVPRVGYVMNLERPLELDSGVAALPPDAAELAAPPPPPGEEVAPPSAAVAAAYSPPRAARWPWLLGAAALLAGAAGALLMVPQPEPRVPAAWSVLRMAPVTTYPGREIYPALSPDGGQMVFSGRLMDKANTDLYQRSVLDGTPIRITSDPTADIGAVWAPDGSQIAYLAYKAGEPCRIMTLAVPGGSPRLVHRCRHSDWTSLSWTPDGKALVFSDEPAPGAPLRLYRLDLSDGTTTQLTESPPKTWGDMMPSVSPDGSCIAFVRVFAWGVQDLVILHLANGKVDRMTNDGQRITGLAWSRDGRGVFFSSNRSGDFGLWWVGMEGGEPRRMSLGLKDVAGLSAARNADRIAFESMSFRANLYEARLTPGGAAEMAPLAASTAVDGDVDVSPVDGTIAFISTRSGTPELWLLAPGQEPRRLTQMSGAVVQAPRWSPDGSSLLFAAGHKGNFDLYRISRDGGSPTRLTDDPAEDLQPSWSADGRSIYFTSRRSGAWRIWRMDAADPARLEPVSGDGPMGARASPDGRTLYYVKDNVDGLWRLPLDGSGPEELLIPKVWFGDWVNFAVTDREIYYIARPGTPRAALMRHDLASGKESMLAEVPDINDFSGIALKPDGSGLVLSRMVVNEIDIQFMDLSPGK